MSIFTLNFPAFKMKFPILLLAIQIARLTNIAGASYSHSTKTEEKLTSSHLAVSNTMLNDGQTRIVELFDDDYEEEEKDNKEDKVKRNIRDCLSKSNGKTFFTEYGTPPEFKMSKAPRTSL